MRKSIADLIRDLVTAKRPDGDVKFKPKETPLIKPPRSEGTIQNESSKPEYSREFMSERRDNGEDAQAYCPVSDETKQIKKRLRKRMKEKHDLK
jgi:hypothetical protein